MPPSSPVTTDFLAFRLASQRSEIKRLFIFLGIVGALILLTIVRKWNGCEVIRGEVFARVLGALGLILCYGVIFLTAVIRADRQRKFLPGWIWVVGTLIESSLPTLALLCMVKFVAMDPLEALAAPAILLYGVFAAATVLRLSPKLCVLFGVFSAGGHAGVTVYAVHQAGNVGQGMILFLGSYSIFLLLTGIVAAFVSSELCRHVIASMEAADLRRRSELLAGELKIAREIQQSLFPKQDLKIPGFEVIGWCKPATETGGDYYDWCRLPSQEGFAMLGDATGHGLGPALLIASCRAYVRADLPQNKDLAGFMNRLNVRLAEDMEGARYVTFVAVIIDEQAGQVKLMSAGHCPALLIRAATGTVETIKAHGVPLGLLTDFPFVDPLPIQLCPGDRLVVYTDGITEATSSDGVMFGLDRLIQAVVRHGGLEGQAFVEALYREAVDFTRDERLRDDLTFLSIRRL